MARELPSGHEKWCQPVKYQKGDSQWESAISRQTAQYHVVERHAREVDCVHRVGFTGVEKKARDPHFDDQV